jgi:dipeptidyl aminopeptidase/acylaminoacyl peptidase
MAAKQRIIFIFIITFIFLIGLLFFGYQLFFAKNAGFLNPDVREKKETIMEKPLLKYSFENIKKTGGIASKIKLEKILRKNSGFTSFIFSYLSNNRKISGLLHLPDGEEKKPIIVMLRGYVDKNEYQTGIGTRPAGEYYAKEGFITIAPDYLGYGGSDMPPQGNIWEERFLRHVAVQDLFSSLGTLANADTDHVFLWGHSNGGMESLAALEISGKDYPTVLWAPVSAYFPYDVLYYLNEAEDKGKALRKELADFEKDYDVDNYSIATHLDWIKAPVQLHQGSSDLYIPLSWSDDLASVLKENGNKVNYFVYPGTDHNMRPSWDVIVKRDVEFFKSHLKE